MHHTEVLRQRLPDEYKDVRLNLSTVLAGVSSLSEAQRWGTAVAAAAATRQSELYRAISADAAAQVDAKVLEDARAAAALMAMNNVYYRFRHLVEKPSYGEKRAGLRMNRIGQPATSKLDFELFSLAVSALNGCGVCMQSHERAVVAGGLTEDQVLDAVRIAAVMSSAAQALVLLDPVPGTHPADLSAGAKAQS
ncbi:MAG TPA: carboxymuconolactone decarboxylase family protein [Planctomycetota bacterium]|nr:carboxymuconolactone decarboxylase family protein [Planctomycetota bacterium]